MNIDEWLMTTEQPTRVLPGSRSGYPESMALISYPDAAEHSQNVIHHHRLSTDIAAAMSVALERIVDVPNEMATTIEGHHEVTFLPLGVTVDRGITGPLPPDSVSRITEMFRQVAGLPDNDIPTIGAATSMFHGALLLHDRDVRSAYTLLVAGIELLSREYGEPPTEWTAWELKNDWDSLFIERGLSVEQADAIRKRLMADRQLRLKATFKSYASSRLPTSFWDKSWVEWMYPVQVPPVKWEAPEKLHDGCIRDFLPIDRAALGKALGESYDLRSQYVHEGKWFGPLELTLNPATSLDVSSPLPFAVLRAILRELIRVEIASRTREGALPDVRLQRNWAPPAGQSVGHSR